MRTVGELTDLLRSQGRKLTPQRQCILDVLAATEGGHPAAEAVHAAVVERLPMVSLKTVYQTLNDLVALGELRHLDLGSGAARFDVNVTAHHHLVCDTCGRIWDVVADAPPLELPAGAAEFVVATTDIVYRGQCAPCRAGRTHQASAHLDPLPAPGADT